MESYFTLRELESYLETGINKNSHFTGNNFMKQPTPNTSPVIVCLSVCLSETKNHSFFNKTSFAMKLCQNTFNNIKNKNL